MEFAIISRYGLIRSKKRQKKIRIILIIVIKKDLGFNDSYFGKLLRLLAKKEKLCVAIIL